MCSNVLSAGLQCWLAIRCEARLTNRDASLETHWHSLNLLSISKSSQTLNVVMSLAAASEARKGRLLALRKKRAGEDAEGIRYV